MKWLSSTRSLGLWTHVALLAGCAGWVTACGSEAANSSGTGGTGGGAVGTGGAGGNVGSGGAAQGGAPATGGGGGGLVIGVTKDCGEFAGGTAPLRFEAECAHGASEGDCNGAREGSQSGTELENGGTSVGYVEPGDWLQFSDVDLTGHTRLTVRYAKGVPDGSLEVRVDGPTGTLIGQISPPPTDGWTSWSEVDIPLDATTGSHDLYVVAAGSGTAGIANLDSFVLSSGEGDTGTGSVSALHINHLGYEALGPKHAVVVASGSPARYEVVNEAGEAVWCGELEPLSFDAWGSSEQHYVVDFSGLTALGEFRVHVDGEFSGTFEIAERRYFDATFEAVLGYFTGSRADEGDVWAADANIPLAGSGRSADVRGGWYDASGDISKYLSHLSYANYMNPQQIPLVAWALGWVHDVGGELLGPQNLQAKVQEEALWGADYLLRVLDPAGYFYINVFDVWTGDLGARQVCAFEGSSGVVTSDFQAAWREGGGLSIAALARIAKWGVAGSFSAAEYLAGAEKAFAHLQQNGAAYADDGRENVIDDYAALLAAAELYATTENAQYLEAAQSRATALANRLHEDGYFIADGGARPFWHASDAGLPVVALARYVEVEPDEQKKEAAREAIRTHLNYLVQVTDEVVNPFGYARQHFNSGGALKSGFFIPHDNETDYWWQGESARLGSLAAAAILGGRAAEPTSGMFGIPDEWARYAARQVDWILGSNPLDMSFLRGFGSNNPPEYCSHKPQHSTLVGGISNGITGRETDGSGFQWTSGSTETCWEDWRWVEQWLPHSTWYMVAVTAMAL